MEKSLTTFFAPAERDQAEQVLMDIELIKKEKQICDILNSLPEVILILNKYRQVVFANLAFSGTDEEEALVEKIGLRPGELLGCIHSLEESGGCGTSVSCRYCGAVQTILESQNTGKKISNQVRLTSNLDKYNLSFDFQITSAPINIKNNTFSLLTLVDISSVKRKEILERIFFHDLLNKAGSLNCFFESLASPSKGDKNGKMLEVAANLSSEIVEEINAHRSILDAEKGELIVTKTKILSKVIIENVVKQMCYHTVAYEKTITIHPEAENIAIYTDYYLIIRVIMNMLKNALEATSREGIVIVSCNKLDDKVRFWVQNCRLLEEEVAQQIFQRSFSTKGQNRGLGTYSMKLIGENYLGGRISFESTKEKGTVFYFDIPCYQ